jgi:hypothetical protein
MVASWLVVERRYEAARPLRIGRSTDLAEQAHQQNC